MYLFIFYYLVKIFRISLNLTNALITEIYKLAVLHLHTYPVRVTVRAVSGFKNRLAAVTLYLHVKGSSSSPLTSMKPLNISPIVWVWSFFIRIACG